MGATDHGSQARSSRLGDGTWEGRVFEFSSFFLAFSPLVSGQETKGKLKTLNGWLRMFRREPSSCLFGAHRSASGQCWCARLSSPAGFSWGTKVSPVLRLGESPAKIHCWLQPWPVLCHVARVQLGPTGRKRGRGWDRAGKGMDAARGAAACPQGAEGDRGVARGCRGCPRINLGWQPQIDTLTRPRAGEAAGPPPQPTPGGTPMGWRGSTHRARLWRGLGAFFNPSEGRCTAPGCHAGCPWCGQSPSSKGGASGAAAALGGGVQAVPRWFPPMSSNPPPTLCARGWHCRTPALGSLRHRNVYFSKFFVSVLFCFFTKSPPCACRWSLATP